MKTPFNLLVVGMTACGKTKYLLEMLKKDHRGTFDFIVLICPTFEWNKTYLEADFVMKDEDFVTIPCGQDDVDAVLSHVVDVYKGTETLIILDDCAASQSVKGRCSTLVMLAFSARHYGLSTIVITQQLTSIAKPYRENIAGLTVFYLTNRNDMKTITDDYLDLSKEEIKEIVKTLKGEKWARLEISLRHPFGYKIISPIIKDATKS